MSLSDTPLEDLLENIGVYRVLIECDASDSEDKRYWNEQRAALEAEVKRRQAQSAYVSSNNVSVKPDIKSDVKSEEEQLNGVPAHRSASSHSKHLKHERHSLLTYPAVDRSPSLRSKPQNLVVTPSLSRKRFRDALEDESNEPPNKSRKSTPVATSPALSTSDSVASDFFDNIGLDEVKNDWRRSKQKIKQEQEDERLARQLEREMLEEAQQAAPSSSQFSRPSSQYTTQATFQPNGAFAARIPQPYAVKPDPGSSSTSLQREPGPVELERRTVKQESPYAKRESSTDSDDSLTEMTSHQWNTQFPAAAGPSRIMPQSFQMPGTFPQGPSFVYGNRWARQDPGSSSQNPYTVDNSLAAGIAAGGHVFGRDYDVGTESNTLTADDLRRLYENTRPDEELEADDEETAKIHSKMKITLMAHQKKGVAWMKKMEDSGNKGGILADDMGLGKTIQAIALMVSRPPDPAKKLPTLIVCPVALMEQWKRELEKLIVRRHRLTVCVLHQASVATSTWDRIKQHDVIITSYGKLGGELKKHNKWQAYLSEHPDAVKTPKEELIVLNARARFHRVFLDEAQAIKNKSTLASHAACRLVCTFRWCLTGTPMQNNVEEMYSLIKFCRITPYNNQERWSRDIGRPLKLEKASSAQQLRAMQKLQALLKSILLRRDKKSKIDGKPILQLPDKHSTRDRAILEGDELAFYKALETQSRIQFNKYLSRGTTGSFYSIALVLLLRLRQCCCSPQLVMNSKTFIADGAATEGGGAEGLDMVANARSLPEEVRNRLKEIDQECPVCYDVAENPIIFNPCGHCLCPGCFSKMVDSVHSEASAAVKCPNCRAPIATNKITDLLSFNEAWGTTAGASLDDDIEVEVEVEVEVDQAEVETASEDDSDSDSGSDEDEDLSDDGEDLRDFIVNDDEEIPTEQSDEDDDDLDRPISSRHTSSQKAKKKKKSSKGKGKKKKKDEESIDVNELARLRREGLKNKAAKKRYLKKLGKIYKPSAKIEKTLQLLTSINAHDNTGKVIVFSSFTSFLDMIEVPLSKDPNFKNYTRYDGSMTAKARNEAIMTFQDDASCRVMLISLKAGNSGLNLTVANHVLLLDPFWNPFVEYQAADRCHRIGQQKEVFVHNVIMGREGFDHDANPDDLFTVEDRILQLQDKKRKLVEAALDENAASSISRLGIRELGFLFGANDLPAGSGRA